MQTRQLSPIGVEILGADLEAMLEDEHAPREVLDLLEANGVLVFPELGLDDEQLVMFGRHLGPTVTKTTKGWDRVYPELFTITMDPEASAGAYMRSTFDWHIDGTTLTVPQKASLLTARVIPEARSDTQFASTYAAYQRLSEKEKTRFNAMKVWHDLEATHRRHDPDPSPEMLERLRAQPPVLQPLVWTHHSGRKSLVIGTPASHIDGVPPDESREILVDLLERATAPSLVYSHDWKVGDLVIWDNRGVLHRALPYADDSGREMKRVTLAGDEPIR